MGKSGRSSGKKRSARPSAKSSRRQQLGTKTAPGSEEQQQLAATAAMPSTSTRRPQQFQGRLSLAEDGNSVSRLRNEHPALGGGPMAGHQHMAETHAPGHHVSDLLRAKTSSEAESRRLFRRESSASFRSRTHSESMDLSNVLSHYMHDLDAEDSTDLLASRYYGNMTHIQDNADRRPKPMNSTLPLFSPSVINERRIQRVHSVTGSDSASIRRLHSGTGARVRSETPETHEALEPMSAPADKANWDTAALLDQALGSHISEGKSAANEGAASNEADAPALHKGPAIYAAGSSSHAGESTRLDVSGSREQGLTELPPAITLDTGSEHMRCEGTAAGTGSAEPHGAIQPGRQASISTNLAGLQTFPEPSAPSSPVRPRQEGPMDGASASQPLLHRVSICSGTGSETNEKGDALGVQVGSRPSSQARMRKAQNMGTTQYKPAATAKKSTLVRGAPGLSYMFSPTVSASRPASVVGVPPPPSRAGDVGSVTYRSTPQMYGADEFGALSGANGRGDSSPPEAAGNGSSGIAADQSDTAESQSKPVRKTYGSINISALEQFLVAGEIPDSTSEEDSMDDYSLEEDYAESETGSLFTGQSVYSAVDDKQQHQQQAAQPYVNYSPKPFTEPASFQRLPAPASQFSPRVRSIGRLPTTDERTPLLQRSATMSPRYTADDSRFIIPADLPVIGEGGNGGGYNSRRHSSLVPKHSKRRSERRRRSRKHHEELFLDKDGFIDESYRFTFFNPAVGTIRSQELADLRTPTMDLCALLQAGGCFWIDVLRPSFQEMHLISKIFGIHALTVEDIMTQDVREKCEVHANYYFVCFKSFDSDPNSETYLEPKCIYNVVMREGIITFHMDPAVHQYHVLRRIRRQIDHIVVTPDWLNYAIIDDITDLLAPILQIVEFDVDSIDELVLVISSSEQSDMLLRISTVRKRIMMMLRLLQGKADVVRALIKRFESATAMSASQMNAIAGNTSGPGYAAERQHAAASQATQGGSPRRHTSGGGEPAAALPADLSETALEVALDQRKGHETLLYLGDVLDHIATMTQNAAHYDNTLGRAHANYLAQISIELTESSNRTNDVVAKLSALAAIVVPLNFVTGMWGANVKVPGQDYDDLNYFFLILGSCMLYVVAAVAWARHSNIF